MKGFTTLRNLYGTFTRNTATDNLTLGDQLINDGIRALQTKYFGDERSRDITLIINQIFYNLPHDFKQLVGATVSIGTQNYIITEVNSKKEWDRLNEYSYSANQPERMFIFNKQIGFYPEPSEANVVTISYKKRFKDLSNPDYVTGTVTATNGDATITGSGTTFTSDMPGRWIRVTSPAGDGEWYQIDSYTSATALELKNTYQGITVAGASYTIAEMPDLPEDFHITPVYGASMVYWTGQKKDEGRYQMYKDLYTNMVNLMEASYGKSKSTSVSLTSPEQTSINPNNFLRY